MEKPKVNVEERRVLITQSMQGPSPLCIRAKHNLMQELNIYISDVGLTHCKIVKNTANMQPNDTCVLAPAEQFCTKRAH